MSSTDSMISPLYGEVLSAIHHADFGFAARGAAGLLLDELEHLRAESDERGALARPTVVDLGCGSGILSRLMSDAGYEVVGFDISESMVAIATEHAPRARITRASVLDAEIPACVAVAAVGEVFNYELDERAGPEALGVVARRIHEALSAGGCFLFDVAGPGRAGPSSHVERVFENDERVLTSRIDEDRDARRLDRRISVFQPVEGSPGLYHRTVEHHRLRLITAVEVMSTLRDIGFEVRRLNSYPCSREVSATWPAEWNVFLARKPKPLAQR